MKNETKQQLAEPIQNFRLPRYQEIPNVGLYLEQTTKFIAEALAPLGESPLTASMISNYVKKHLVSSPVKKQYDRDQIAHLMFIALGKNVLSLDDLYQFLRLQERTYTVQKAYDYFCDELENVLRLVFGLSSEVADIHPEASDEKVLLRNIIITIAHKIYLEKIISAMTAQAQSGEGT